VNRLFDTAGPAPARPVPSPVSAVEQLELEIECGSLDRFYAADNATWTAFLAKQQGFVSKTVTVEWVIIYFWALAAVAYQNLGRVGVFFFCFATL
jgi:hypothetical protein